MRFKKLISGIAAFALASSAFAGLAITADAATYTDQQADLSAFDTGATYDSTTDTASVTVATKSWSKLDLKPYTTSKGDHVSKVTVSYTETVPSGGRSAIGFYDADKAIWATNSYQDVTGSAICYGVMGGNTDKRVYINGSKASGKFSVDASESVSLTFDLDNETISGSIGAHSVSGSISGIDSIDTLAIYSWSEMTYTISDLKITTEISDTAYYTVTYSVGGVETKESVIENGTVAKVPDTDSPGYIFKGWSTDGTSEYDETKTYMTTDEIKAAAITADITYTAVYAVDADYIEPIVSAVISGPTSMTFGADTDTAADNAYTVTLTGEKGTVITSDTKDSRVTDMKVKWDIEGFKTENDTDGQYCDSYGAFETNNTDATTVNFGLKDVPMNFYGRVTATVTYNGSKTEATPLYVVALGDKTVDSKQVLPSAGYPSDFCDYPSDLVGYTAATASDNRTGTDIITDNFVLAGSSGKSATLTEEDGVKFFKIYKEQASKSGMFAHTLSLSGEQTIFKQRVRFNSNGATITFTTNYPIWNSNNKYAVTFDMLSNAASINGSALLDGESTATIETGVWYDLVISLDPSSSMAWAKISTTDGTLVGEVSNVAFTDAGTVPTYYAVGMGNSYTGTIDFAGYEAYYPTADESQYTLSSDKDTLSIPAGDTATLTASLKSTEGYDITGVAEWSVEEEDMQESVIITPDESDSHQAVVSLADGAQPGTATIKVMIGGYSKTIALNVTSSAESVKFTSSASSVSIPLDASSVTTVQYTAAVVDGDGNAIEGRDVTLAVYDKANTSEYTLPDGITFDTATGLLTVTADAAACSFTIRATGTNTDGNTISRGIKVTVHGLAFDFGAGTDEDLTEGYTAVTPSTTYDETKGYGIVGTATAGGTASTDDATSDYLAGAITFKANVQKAKYYTVEITYQGALSAEYVSEDLASASIGNQTALATATYTVPVVDDVLDLSIASYTYTYTDSNGDSQTATADPEIAAITVTKQADRTARSKPVIHQVGDSTAANNGSWAYRLSKNMDSYPALSALADFYNNGAGGRNLCTYYTQGKLISVLNDIYPGDIVMFGNNGTNGMGNAFDVDVNYYLDAAEAMGAKIIINSYTPHGAVGNYTSGYDSTTHTFNSYRTDSYDVIVRAIAEERAASDSDYLGFVEIGKNADAAFNAYVADYAANGYESADAAAQAIIACFTDHNHYSNGTLACDLMLNGYGDTKGIVAQIVDILSAQSEEGDPCVEIVAQYNSDGTLDKIVSITETTTDKTSASTEGTTKTFVWDSISGMKPVE